MDIDSVIEAFNRDSADFIDNSSSDKDFNITFSTEEFQKDSDIQDIVEEKEENVVEEKEENVLEEKEEVIEDISNDSSAITLQDSSTVPESESPSVSGFDYVIFIGLIVVLLLFLFRKKKGD